MSAYGTIANVYMRGSEGSYECYAVNALGKAVKFPLFDLGELSWENIGPYQQQCAKTLAALGFSQWNHWDEFGTWAN
jgi:hypothetical protein